MYVCVYVCAGIYRSLVLLTTEEELYVPLIALLVMTGFVRGCEALHEWRTLRLLQVCR